MQNEKVAQVIDEIGAPIRQSEHLAHFVAPAATLTDGESDRVHHIRADLPSRIIDMARSRKTIFIFGGPGSGKTTLWLAMTAAMTRRQPPLVPVTLNVHWFAAYSSRKALLRAALGRWLTDAEITDLELNERILFLIDGLNEIAYASTVSNEAKQLLTDLIAGSERCPVIATTRSPVPDVLLLSGPLRKESIELILQPFDTARVEEVVSSQGVDVDSFMSYLENGRLLDLVGNPQLLGLVIALFRAEPNLAAPASVVELFERFFNAKWAQNRVAVEGADVSKTAFSKALATLAFHMQVRGLPSATPEAWTDLLEPFAEVLERNGLDRQAIVNRAHAYYIMELHDNLQFVHDRFRSHFAARFLRHLEGLPDVLWMSSAWEDALAHYAGLSIESPDSFIGAAIARQQTTLVCKIAALNYNRIAESTVCRVFDHLAADLCGSRARREFAATGLAEFSSSIAIARLRQTTGAIAPRDRPNVWRAIELIRSGRLTPEQLRLARHRAERAERAKHPRAKPRQTNPLSHDDEFAAAVRDLADQNRADYLRAPAAKWLGNSGNSNALRPLIDALRDAAPAVRGSAANALGTIGDRSAVLALSDALKDAEPAVRGSAANALGTIGDRSAVAALSDALKAAEPAVRGSAANALGSIGDRSAIAALSDTLKDSQANVRGSAANALGSIGDRSAVAALSDTLKDSQANVRGSAAHALGTIGDRSAVPALSDALKDSEDDVRGSAANALGSIGDRSAVLALSDTLKDSEANVRGSAANALGSIGDRSAIAALSNTLKDSDSYVRGSAANALGSIGDRSAVAALSDALKDAEPAVRGSAANALGSIGDRSAVPALSDALKDSQVNVRVSAAKALGSIGDRSAVAALSDSLNDPEPAVRGSAANALGMIGDRSAVPALSDALKDTDSYVRSSIGRAFQYFLGSDAHDILDKLRCDNNPKVRGAALKSIQLSADIGRHVEGLRQSVDEDSDGWNRTVAIQGLSIVGTAADIPRLEAALYDPDAGARGQASRALVLLLPCLESAAQIGIATKLGRFWAACRISYTFNTLDATLLEMPFEYALIALREAASHAANLPDWKRARLASTEQSVLSKHRFEQQLHLLAERETELIRRLWGVQDKATNTIISRDLQEFIKNIQPDLWDKLRTAYTASGGQRQRKEGMMQDLVEMFWKGLGRGHVYRELRAGSGRMDLIAHYGVWRTVFELKILEDIREDYERGLAQLREYLRQNFVRHGVLLLFAEDKDVYDQLCHRLDGHLTTQIGPEQVVNVAVVRAWRPPAPSSLT